jgi:hypothetical protein
MRSRVPGRRSAEAVPPGLDPAVAEALDAFVERRKREINSAERAGIGP